MNRNEDGIARVEGSSISFQFSQVVKRSFVLNGKRYTTHHPTMKAGRYTLIAQPTTPATTDNHGDER